MRPRRSCWPRAASNGPISSSRACVPRPAAPNFSAPGRGRDGGGPSRRAEKPQAHLCVPKRPCSPDRHILSLELATARIHTLHTAAARRRTSSGRRCAGRGRAPARPGHPDRPIRTSAICARSSTRPRRAPVRRDAGQEITSARSSPSARRPRAVLSPRNLRAPLRPLGSTPTRRSGPSVAGASRPTVSSRQMFPSSNGSLFDAATRTVTPAQALRRRPAWYPPRGRRVAWVPPPGDADLSGAVWNAGWSQRNPRMLGGAGIRARPSENAPARSPRQAGKSVCPPRTRSSVRARMACRLSPAPLCERLGFSGRSRAGDPILAERLHGHERLSSARRFSISR